MAMTIGGEELKKCNVDGIPCKRINCNGIKVWSSSVTLTNVFGKTTTQISGTSLTTSADRSEHVSGTAVAVTAGHRYYARATTTVPSIASVGQSHSSYAWFSNVSGSQYISDITYSPASGFTSTSKTDHKIFAVPSGVTSITPTLVWSVSANTPAATHTATFLTLIDITDLETETGTTYTADSFWTDVLESKLFGTTKEIELN